MYCHFELSVSTTLTYFPFRNVLSVWTETSLLSLSPSLPPSVPPPLYKVTVPPQRPLLCRASPPPPRQADGGTGLPFSQSHFLTALCSSRAFNIPAVELFSFPAPRVVVSRPFAPHPRCKVLRGRLAAGACVCVWDCFTMPSLVKLSDLCPLF